jgi:flagellar hook-length control protein FliK
MELNPPDLGPLQVVLSVNKDQATAAFSSAAPEVRQALERPCRN